MRRFSDTVSWDLSFYSADSPPPPVNEMPSDWEPSRFGTLEETRKQISACLPDVDWFDPFWGIYEGQGFSIEFNIGKEDHSFGFTVHVRGRGSAVSELVRLAEEYNWYVLDWSQGEWLHHCADSDAGWRGFQDFRDRVIGNTEKAVGLGSYDTEREVPGTQHWKGKETRYVSCDENTKVSVMFRKVVRHVTPPLPTDGGVMNEACVVALPSGARYFALTYKGDIDGWRKQIEQGAAELGLSLAEIQGDRIVLADGAEVPLSDCDVYFD